ncbi:MAG: heterodisulfide reductase-related iron-sulfur binding cluster, partial [Actinomycetota bacterium]
WKHMYPQIARAQMDRFTYPDPVLSDKLNFNVLQEVQFLYKLAGEGKFKLGLVNKKVAYHDPCDLGRSSGIYDEPRELIKLIPGVEFIELQHIREDSKCCGGGGNLEAASPELSAGIAKIRAQEIIDSGADIVISSCQQCVRTLAGALKKEKSKIKAMDISELLLESIEGTAE